MARMRSPNYPQLSLAEAMERVKKIYIAEHTHPSSREILVQHLGYSGLNGASAVVLGALNRYGLLEGRGEDLRVSDNAVTIIELPHEDPTRQKALREAAFLPPLFADLRNQFGNSLPSSATLRHSLIKQGFLPKAADDVIQIYRDNMTLVGADNGEYNNLTALETYDISAPTQLQVRPLLTPETKRSIPVYPNEPEGSHELRFNLSPESGARVIFSGHVTQEGIKKLMKLLEISVDTFPSKVETSEPLLALRSSGSNQES